MGAAAVEVDLPPAKLASAVEDLPGAVGYSLRLLGIGLQVTVPLLASVCLGPVASVLNPDTSMSLQGASGSYKPKVIPNLERFETDNLSSARSKRIDPWS